MIPRDLPEEFCVNFAKNTTQIRLGALVEPLVRIDAEGRHWVYESYRNTLGLGKSLVGLEFMYGPTDAAGARAFLDGYLAGEAVRRRGEKLSST